MEGITQIERRSLIVSARSQLNLFWSYAAVGVSTFAALLTQSATVFVVCLALGLACLFSEGFLRPSPVYRKR